jgi:hypothetical protein
MGKNTFETFKESQDAGEYILNKKTTASFCNPNVCVPNRALLTQSNRLLLRKANNIYFGTNQDHYNRSNLNINLVTKLNLSDVPVIIDISGNSPAQLDVTSIPYLDYTIDPSGNLFGDTICGTNNFQNYLQFNPPTYKTTRFNNNLITKLTTTIIDTISDNLTATASKIQTNYTNLNNGTWNSVGGGVNNLCSVIAVHGDKLYIGGNFSRVGTPRPSPYTGGVPVKRIAVYDLTTGVWSALGSGLSINQYRGNPFCSAITFSSDGTKVYVGGDFTNAGGVSANCIAMYNLNTNIWSALGSGLNNSVRDILLSSDETKVYACGSFTQTGGNPANYIAVYDLVTGVWTPLGSGINNYATKMQIIGTKMYVCGGFTQAGGNSANYIAVYNLVTGVWSPLGSGLNNLCNTIALYGDKLYACGTFTQAGGNPANYIAVYDLVTNVWSPLGSGLNNYANTMSIIGTKIYVGGTFTQADNISTKNIAIWEISNNSWSVMSSPYIIDNDVILLYATTSYGLFCSWHNYYEDDITSWQSISVYK